MAKPTFVASYLGGTGTSSGSANWGNEGVPTTRSTASFSVLAGDRLICMAASADTSFTFAAAGPDGGSLTWTSLENIGGTNFCRAQAWTATVDSNKSMTVTIANDGSTGARFYGMIVYHFRASSGFGAAESTSVTNTAPSRAITTTAANSAIVYISTDWAARDGASRTWRTINSITPTSGNGLEKVYFRDAAQYSVYSGYWDDAGTAAAKTTGLTGPTAQEASMIAIEVKGGSAAYSVTAVAGAYALTGTAATLTKATPNKSLTAAAGAYALTGTAATLTKASGASSPPAFRSVSNTSYGASDDTIITKPTGTAENDILLAGVMYGRSSVIPADVTPPSGWTQVGTTTSVSDGSFNAKFSVWWKRATASEPANYTFGYAAFETPINQGVMAAYSGGLASGSPVDAASQNSANTTGGSPVSYTGVTTTVANTKLVLVAHNWDGSTTLTPPTGMTERFDIVAYLADETRATAGATSARTQTLASNNPWAGFLVALKPASGGATAYNMAAAAGSYALTGTVTTLTKTTNRTIAAVTGAYAFTGTAATLTKAAPTKTIGAAAGAYALTGSTATVLKHGWKPLAEASSYTLTGSNATLSATGVGGSLPIFRSISSTTYATRVTLTAVDKPVGTVDGDIMVMSFAAGRDNLGDLTLEGLPAGWTAIGTPTAVANAAGTFYVRLYVFWKRAASEGADYTFLHNNGLATQAVIASYSGCIATGNPIDVLSQNSGLSAIAVASSVTASANTKLIYTGHNWDGTASLEPPPDMTERLDSLIYHADSDRVSPGATGDLYQDLASANPWQAYLLALKPNPSAPSPFALPPINPAAFLPFLVR